MIEVVIAFARQYWKQIACITFMVLIFAFGYYKGYSHEKARFDEHLQTDATLMAMAKAENDRKIKEAKSVTDDVTEEYANAISKINEYYKSHPHIVQLCKPNKTNTVSSTSKSPTRIAETADRVAEAVTAPVTIDLRIAAKEIKQCQMLIELEGRLEEIQ